MFKRKHKKHKKKVAQVVEQEQKDFEEALELLVPSTLVETLPRDEIDTLAESKASFNNYYVEVGTQSRHRRYFTSQYIQKFGKYSNATMLDPFLIGEFGKGDTDICIHLKKLDDRATLDKLNRKIRGQESDLMMNDADSGRTMDVTEALRDTMSKRERIRQKIESNIQVSIQVLTSSNDIDDLNRYTNTMNRNVLNNDMMMGTPDGRQLKALKNMLPFTANPFIKEHCMALETTNVADLFLFGNGTLSHSDGIVLGDDHLGRPLYFDNFHKDMENYNMIIFGRSGAGKTFTTEVLTHRSAHIGLKTGIVDPKGDYRRFIKAMGCPYFDLSSPTGHRINIFDVDIEEHTDPEREGQLYVNIDEGVQGAKALIFRMIRVNEPENSSILTATARAMIDQTIRQLYTDRGITRDPNSIYDYHAAKANSEGALENGQDMNLTTPYKKMPQLSDFYEALRAKTNNGEAQTIAEVIFIYTRGGGSEVSSIFDTQSSTFNLSRAPIFGFGLSGLDEQMKKIGMFIATKWLSAKFARKNRHIPKRLIFDEAQEAMEDQETAAWLENQYRTMRFFNTSMCAITQGFEVFTRVDQGLGILKNSSTKIFLKQEAIDIDSVKHSFDLSEGEAQFLLYTAEKGLGIIRIDNESSIVKVRATPKEFQLFQTDPPRKRKQVPSTN